MNGPLAISAKTVGQLLDISTRQVWAMHSAGTLAPSPVKLSDRVTRWDRSEVEAWWQSCRDAGRTIGRTEWQRIRQGGAA